MIKTKMVWNRYIKYLLLIIIRTFIIYNGYLYLILINIYFIWFRGAKRNYNLSIKRYSCKVYLTFNI